MLFLKNKNFRAFLKKLGFEKTNGSGYDPEDETEYFYKEYGNEYEASGGCITINNEYWNGFYGNIPMSVQFPAHDWECSLEKDFDKHISDITEAVEVVKTMQEDIIKIINYCKTHQK